jgi:hypothetical protein
MVDQKEISITPSHSKACHRLVKKNITQQVNPLKREYNFEKVVEIWLELM